MAPLLALVLVAGLLQVQVTPWTPKVMALADEPSGAATEQEAIAAARRIGEPVEVLSQRGESRTVRALPSGRIEIEQHVEPIRARQNGKWADVDATLSRSGDWIVPAVTTVGLRFSAGGSGPMVQMTRAGHALALSWPQALPSPTLDGDTAVYQGVAGPDVDLRLRAQADGFAHVLVIKTAEAAKDPRVASLALALATSRLAVTEEQGSSVLKAADTNSGAVVFEAPSPMMWDSTQATAASGARSQATVEPDEEPSAGAKTAPIDVAVGDGKLTLTPDQSLLTAPDTKFPVYIDPVWDTNLASSYGMVSSGWPDQSYYKFGGNSTEGVGRCEVAKDPNCVKNQTKRLFFRMPMPSLKGSYIQNVEFTAFETSAYDCDNKTSVQLWRTTTLQSYATWNNTNSSSVWLDQLASRDVAYCSKAPVEFGGATLRSHVQDAANKGHSSITFGLKAYSESTMDWWKRFSKDAYLKVQYNRPPLQPDTDTMFANPGTKCLASGQARIVNDFSTLYAYLKDPDNEDASKVQGQFTLHWANNADGSDWGPKWTSGLTSQKTTGSKFDKTVPLTIPQGKKIAWGVRAWDGEQWGPWSYDGAQTGCYFIYDPAKPGQPEITSTDYPADGSGHGGVGQAGTFTISDPAGVADRFEIVLNGELVTTVSTSAGATQQVQVAPTRYGPNVITVQALAPSHQDGPTSSYEFNANAGSAPLARFKLDEPAGSSAVQAMTREGEPPISATVHGNVTAGGPGHVDRAIQTDGSTGYAATNGPIIDTNDSFSVSAWVWVDASDPDTDFTVLSEEGNYFSAFYLKYVKSTQQWVFARTAYDTDKSGWYQATSAKPARAGTWTHLVGVWDAVAKRLRIYVNGKKGTDSAEVTLTWNAIGGLQIGRGKYTGVPVDYWPGKIDDVRVYDRVLGPDEAKGMVTEAPVLNARWMLNQNGQADPYPENAPALQFQNGAVIDPDAGFGWGASPAGLILGVSAAFAETQTPPVLTDESFTIAGWVRNGGRPQQVATVFSQPGSHANAFELRYVPGEDPAQQGIWQVVMNNFDDATSTPLVASHPRFIESDWVHLAVVYDALQGEVTLYVNGQADETADGVSREDNVFPFKAQNNGGLQVGRNKIGTSGGTGFWPDAIDDVWAYQAALEPPQVAALASGVELPAQTGP